MKILLTILLSLFLVGGAYSQTQQPNGQPVQNSTSWIKYAFVKTDSGYIPALRTDTNMKARYYGTEIIWLHAGLDSVKWYWNGYGWKKNSSTVDSTLFVTHTALNDTLLNYVKIQTQNPTAALTGGANYELHNAGSFFANVNYSGGRLASGTNVAATSPISSIVVNGTSESVSGCSSPPCTISGTQSVLVTWNVNKTVSNVVTTTDGKSATATTAFNFFPAYYIGYSSTSTPTDGDLQSGINNVFPATSKVTSGTLPSPSGSEYIFFAVPSSFGTPNVVINGLSVTYNTSTRSVTNASGYSQNYIISVSPFATSSGVSYSTN